MKKEESNNDPKLCGQKRPFNSTNKLSTHELSFNSPKDGEGEFEEEEKLTFVERGAEERCDGDDGERIIQSQDEDVDGQSEDGNQAIA